MLGFVAALLAVVGVVTVAKGNPIVGGILLLAAFISVAIAYALVRAVTAAARR